ncbi:hypothetical protein Ddye_015073 [Dipteronia dyeriana]|uniref:AAA+ ATPase domain-containing protein n=1 Tax=Dipteronia dyeriana TaxID=168575 RepID=A0AAD9U587_9ROSI|nr:hypothetical protein Ddye_015073 [Dipteronia dyeriana]
MFAQLGSTFGSLFIVWTMFQRYFPLHLQAYIDQYLRRLVKAFDPYIHIKFYEYSSDRFRRSEAYVAIENYLSSKSTEQAKRLKGDSVKQGKSLVLGMDNEEEVLDEFQGVKLFWSKLETHNRSTTISYYPTSGKMYYKLSFLNCYRESVTKSYLNYVLEEGKAIGARNRQKKLYTNNPNDDRSYHNTRWSHVVFEHPATFDTLAMDPKKKEEIIDDLVTFRESKGYYARIGKAWKRGYLLYGPPGTGKSTMIAAIANFLNYDIYDLELTAVKDNTDLRKLLIETSSKSMIVIEDIDCSLALTGQRKKAKPKEEENKAEIVCPIKEKADKENEGKSSSSSKDDSKTSKVTLSGLLNFIDGIWSASGGERLIIFTTNYVEKLDEALIRRGRMDKHIELSYCDFEGFKVLAKNYLRIDSHPLFEKIRSLLEETKITPADVAENLMPKTTKGEAAESCLENLIQALLKTAKEEAMKKKKAEEEEKALKEKEKSDGKIEEEKQQPETNSILKSDKEDAETSLSNSIEVIK